MTFTRQRWTAVWMLLLASSALTTATSPKSWTLYHAVLMESGETPAFVPRGRMQLALKDPENSDNDDADAPKKKPPKGVQVDDLPFHLTLTHNENVLTADLAQSLMDETALYQLKMVPDNGAPTVVTTVPACHVRRANFRDEFVVNLDSNAEAISLTYMPLISPLAPDTCEAYTAEDNAKFTTFDSRLSIETAVPAMTLGTMLPDYQPPPGMNILKGAATGGAGADAKAGLGDDPNAPPPDNSFFGFLKRYWYILLPLFIMNTMVSPPAEEEQQQQQPAGAAGATQQQQGAGAAAAPAVAAAPAAAGGAVRKRRGKRG